MNSIYKVSSSFTLIMSKPNFFSQILGMLTRGTQIEVSSFSGNWACFSYNATTAYVRKNSLKFINNTPTIKTGSVTIKYLDSETNSDVYASQTIDNLSLGTYSYESQDISGYKLTTNSPQSITLTESSPNATITFYYTKILCSITIRYVDENTENYISNSQVINNLSLGTYTYSYIEVSGYKLDDTETKTITFTENNTDITIIFKYKEILGSIVINYIDNSSSTALLEPETISNLKLGNYTYSSKSISGYSILNPSTQTITITAETPNVEITFKYNKLYGSITLQYVDNDSNTKLIDDEKYTNLEFGSYTYSAKSFSNYKLIGSQTQTITINDTNLNATIVFSYSKILGSITIKYLEKDTLVELSPETVLNNIELGSYSFDALSIDGYSISGDTSKIVELTEDILNIEINFIYTKLLGSITIKYLDNDSGESLHDSITNTNLSLGIYSYDSISIDGYTITGSSSQTVNLNKDNLDVTIVFKYEKIEVETIDPSSAFKVPYISTYYFKTKPTIYEDIIIPIYVTDYEQSEYLYDKKVKLDILYQVDENSEKSTSVYSGDNSINLGKLTKGEHYFSIQAIDKTTGLKSHKLYNELLVIDDSYTITDEQTYTINDDDLLKYNLTKVDTTDETQMTNNRIGLTKLFADLQNQGYRKCILPSNCYFRCKKTTGNDLEIRNGAIQIPSNFTVDMNGSTFKLHTNTSDTGNTNNVVDLLVRMDNCYDSHLINGILEGDRAERKALGLETGYKGEPISTFQFLGGKYSSIENLKIKQTTGHTVMSAGGISGGITSISNTNFEKTLIYEGSIIDSDLWSTSQFIDLNKFTMNYITVGRYLGYRGVRGNSLIVYYNFYDESYNFIKMIVGYQYRKTRIPESAKYIKVSFYGDLSTDTNVNMFYFELGTNLEIKNIDFEDTRTCAIATTTSSGLLIDNVTFTRCGYSITPCPVDFEDGWQDCQDIYFMNSKRIGDRVGTADIIDNAGYNHVYENNDNLGYTIRYSVVGLVIRNNNNISGGSWSIGYRETGSGFARILNNIINGRFNTSNVDDTKSTISHSLMKNSRINCIKLDYIESCIKYFSYKNCTISSFNAKYGKFSNCIIYPSPYLWENLIFENCNFYNFENIDSSIKFSFNALNTIREFNNCTFKSPTQLSANNNFNNGTFSNCIFEKPVSINPNQSNNIGDLQFINCNFNDELTINISNINCFIEFINCTFSNNKFFTNYGMLNSIFK